MSATVGAAMAPSHDCEVARGRSTACSCVPFQLRISNWPPALLPFCVHVVRMTSASPSLSRSATAGGEPNRRKPSPGLVTLNGHEPCSVRSSQYACRRPS